MSNDKIVIRDLEIFAFHGVFEGEKSVGQKFLVSLELSLDLSLASRNNDLTKSVHYGELCEKIEAEFKKESYDLIETACEKLCEFVLLEYDIVNEVKVIVKKPWAPIHKSLDTVFIEMTRRWSKAYLSYGSNMGNKREYIERELKILDDSKFIKLIKKSTLIDTKPWGYTEQDDFLNGACIIKTILNPIFLMEFLLDVEKKLDRERKIKWGPRTIDLDIIFYDDLVTDDDFITLPHPRAHLREFVLEPINEIAPNKIHPLYRKRVFELLNEIK